MLHHALCVCNTLEVLSIQFYVDLLSSGRICQEETAQLSELPWTFASEQNSWGEWSLPCTITGKESDLLSWNMRSTNSVCVSKRVKSTKLKAAIVPVNQDPIAANVFEAAPAVSGLASCRPTRRRGLVEYMRLENPYVRSFRHQRLNVRARCNRHIILITPTQIANTSQ